MLCSVGVAGGRESQALVVSLRFPFYIIATSLLRCYFICKFFLWLMRLTINDKSSVYMWPKKSYSIDWRNNIAHYFADDVEGGASDACVHIFINEIHSCQAVGMDVV